MSDVATLITETEALARELSTLPEVADAHMALQYLRHLQRHLAAENTEYVSLLAAS